MFGAYLTAATRNIARRKLNGFISVLGLGLGIAIATMVAIFLLFETSFDTMHPNHERLYRLNWQNVSTGARFATFFNPLSPRIAEALPEDIEAVTRITNSEQTVTIDERTQYETVSFVDPNYFDFFAYGNVRGDAGSAIGEVRNAVLTQAAADKLFGADSDPIGRVFTLSGEFDFTVSAVIENNPINSHLVSNIFLNMELLPQVWGWPNMWDNWGSDQLYHYVRLTPGTDPAAVSARAVDYIANNVYAEAHDWVTIPFQPIKDIHFNTELQNEMTAQDTITGRVKSPRRTSDIYVFMIVGMLTLAIAAFNFMNLQIVQITNRLREVGVRKVLGATRRQVITQFMIETLILSALALFAGIVVTEAGLPFFGGLVGAELPTGMVFQPDVLGLMAVAMILLTVIAGAYPSMIAARLMPTRALRGEVSKDLGPAKVRTGLVLIQFSIATGLIIASGVVGSQINFAVSKPLGFDAANVASVKLSAGTARDAFPAMKQQLEAHPAIESVSSANILPAQDLSDGWSFTPDADDPESRLATRMIRMGEGAFEILGMEMAAGRSFNENFPSDRSPSYSPSTPEEDAVVILNETAARAAGWTEPQQAVGQVMTTRYSRNGVNYQYNFTVVGVVEDAHYRSIRSPIAPLSYFPDNRPSQMIVKFAQGQETQALSVLEAAWQQHVPDTPIRRAMVSEEYAAFYAGENRTFSLVIGLSGVAIAIACLGLYGLTTYMVERRLKEVGIRRVLGATIAQIVTLLSWDYTKLVIVASLLVWPAVWWLMKDWLASFAYRADLEISLFLVSSLLILLLATLTTSARTYLAARTNPIHALRSE